MSDSALKSDVEGNGENAKQNKTAVLPELSFPFMTMVTGQLANTINA